MERIVSDNFNYSLIKNDQGAYVLRSTVKSFNLEQVTDKDIVSFYQNMSNLAAFDTGLLPLDGTGVLAIRAAGNHMQITVQHKPGLYYVNWGSFEHDRDARTYNVAQPYRIVIGDFVDGQLLGARTFYSPYPITHSEQQLYHVNLPNINCKGYRGNGVGWICLYLKEDWSKLPLNEKISRFIERCSGVETYNDANMSETDGTRFYKDREMPVYLWNPLEWEKKSLSEGFQWTLDPSIWIPVKVSSMDEQGNHSDQPNSIPYTLAVALLGKYKAYYQDDNPLKWYNVVARKDLNITNSDIAQFIKKSFSSSSAYYQYNAISNSLIASSEARESKSLQAPELPFNQDNEEQEEEEEIQPTWQCLVCQEAYTENFKEPIFDHAGNAVCEDCISENYCYIDSVGEYFSTNDLNIYYDDSKCLYFHKKYDTVIQCKSCDSVHTLQGKPANVSGMVVDFIDANIINHQYCSSCIDSYASKYNLKLVSCYCETFSYIEEHLPYIINSQDVKHYIKPLVKWPLAEQGIPTSLEINYTSEKLILCGFCNNNKSLVDLQTCPCGKLVNSNDLNKCVITPFQAGDAYCEVSSACSTCIGKLDTYEGILLGEFVPMNPSMFVESLTTGVASHSASVNYQQSQESDLSKAINTIINKG